MIEELSNELEEKVEYRIKQTALNHYAGYIETATKHLGLGYDAIRNFEEQVKEGEFEWEGKRDAEKIAENLRNKLHWLVDKGLVSN